MQWCQVRTRIVPHFGWAFCLVIFSAQYLKRFLLATLNSNWFLGQTAILSKSPRYMLSLSCRSTVLLLGGGYYLWLWFFLEIHTAPILMQACLQMIRLYRDVLSFALHSTILRVYYCLFQLNIFNKRDVNLAHLFYLKGGIGSVPRVWHKSFSQQVCTYQTLFR